MATANHRRSVRDTATPGSARMLTTPRSTNGLNLSGSSASSRPAQFSKPGCILRLVQPCLISAFVHDPQRPGAEVSQFFRRSPISFHLVLRTLIALPGQLPFISQRLMSPLDHTVLKRRFTAGHRRSCRYGIECVLLHQAKGQVFVLMLFDRLDRALARIPLISDGRARYYHVSQRYLLHVG